MRVNTIDTNNAIQGEYEGPSTIIQINLSSVRIGIFYVLVDTFREKKAKKEYKQTHSGLNEEKPFIFNPSNHEMVSASLIAC